MWRDRVTPCNLTMGRPHSQWRKPNETRISLKEICLSFFFGTRKIKSKSLLNFAPSPSLMIFQNAQTLDGTNSMYACTYTNIYIYIHMYKYHLAYLSRIITYMGVSKNRGFYPKSSILIGFSMFSLIFTIHFGGFPPIFGNIQILCFVTTKSLWLHLLENGTQWLTFLYI